MHVEVCLFIQHQFSICGEIIYEYRQASGRMRMKKRGRRIPRLHISVSSPIDNPAYKKRGFQFNVVIVSCATSLVGGGGMEWTEVIFNVTDKKTTQRDERWDSEGRGSVSTIKSKEIERGNRK
jgi:hypothetical protein